jgi:hypothetical protein
MQISGHNNVASINSARNGGKDSLKLVFHSISQPRQINSIFTINRPILYISFTTIYKLLVGKFCWWHECCLLLLLIDICYQGTSVIWQIVSNVYILPLSLLIDIFSTKGLTLISSLIDIFSIKGLTLISSLIDIFSISDDFDTEIYWPV